MSPSSSFVGSLLERVKLSFFCIDCVCKKRDKERERFSLVLCVAVVLAVSAIGTKMRKRELLVCAPFLVTACGKERESPL